MGDAFAAGAEPCRFVGDLNSSDLSALRKIHHRKAVRRAKLCEDPATRAVGVILNYYRIYRIVVLNLPCDFLALEIKND